MSLELFSPPLLSLFFLSLCIISMYRENGKTKRENGTERANDDGGERKEWGREWERGRMERGMMRLTDQVRAGILRPPRQLILPIHFSCGDGNDTFWIEMDTHWPVHLFPYFSLSILLSLPLSKRASFFRQRISPASFFLSNSSVSLSLSILAPHSLSPLLKRSHSHPLLQKYSFFKTPSF